MTDMTGLREKIMDALAMDWKGYCTYDGPSNQPCCSAWIEDRNGRVFESDIEDIIKMVVTA